jgi:hypothetical protein
MTTASAIIEKLDINLETATAEELQSKLFALEDGEALKFMGFGDEDIPAIEEAYTLIENALNAKTPRFLTMITDERIGDTLIFDPETFDFNNWIVDAFGAEFNQRKADLEVQAYDEEWSDEDLASEIRNLEERWFNPDNYRGETLEHLEGNIYVGDSGKYEVTPDGNGLYNAKEVTK